MSIEWWWWGGILLFRFCGDALAILRVCVCVLAKSAMVGFGCDGDGVRGVMMIRWYT